jgi:hypothetical protein
MAIPRIARAPHTAKAPEASPHCGGRALTRRGTRKKKYEIVQLWRCASCKRVFTPGVAALSCSAPSPAGLDRSGFDRWRIRLHSLLHPPFSTALHNVDNHALTSRTRVY